MMLSKPLRVVWAVVALLLLLVAMFVSQAAFQRVLNFRALERIPLTTVLTSTGGEVQLRGQVKSAGGKLNSPDTQTEVVYYRYLIEEEYRDSEGNKKWRTIRNEKQTVDFYLVDNSGKAYVASQEAIGHINWSAPRKFRQVRGDRRYTEWRLDINDTVTLFGWMTLTGDEPSVSFRQAGDYLPIISSYDAVKERGDIGWMAVMLLALSITALTFMCFFFACSLAIHRVIVLLTFVTISASLMLLHYGWRSLENDVGAGYKRVETQIQRSENLLQQKFNTLGLAVPNAFAFDTRDSQFQHLPRDVKDQLNGWRMAAAMVRTRYEHQIDRYPEKLFAAAKGLTNPTRVPLPDDQADILEQAVASFQATRIGGQIILTLLGLVIMAALAWLAFLFIRVKRMQENLPTSKASGVVYGLSEVVGKLVPENTAFLLEGPLSGAKCTWYHYIVTEKRGSGKNSHWVTIENDLKKQAFYCQDDTGQLRVFPNKAEIITKHKTIKRRGKRRYVETRLVPGDDLYLLGTADIDKTAGDTLVMREAKRTPFIISNRSEREVMFNKAAKGMALLSLSVCLMFFTLLIIAASSGEFSSLDYILTALAAPLFFVVLMIIITYNDIVFLKQRCQRAWANIQVSLKKRHTLIPRLESVLKAMANHEKELQTKLVEMRNLDKETDDANTIQQYLRAEHQFIDRLQVTIEAYPEIKSDINFQMLHKSLIKLENEIAMIRAGFNDSVEYYNTRIQHFPDVLLAKLGRFKRLSLLDFDQEVHRIPNYTLSE